MEIILHPRTSTALDVIEARPAGSYLFHGPRSVGKATAAMETARRLVCENTGQDAAGTCPACRQLAAGTYPDLELLKPESKTSITIEQVRLLIEHLSRRPYYQGKTRIAIVDDAHRLTLDAANALLKIIEEPPDHTIFILVAEQPEALLATIRSRCTAIYFTAPSTPDLAAWLSRRFGLTLIAATDLSSPCQ
jgi:DNA polymerase-3 subunit delta'